MLIAKELEKTNIAEYVLYMWQVEDIIRANNFNIELLKQNIILKYDQSQHIIKKIENWYEGLIDLMKVEKIEKQGHFKFIIKKIDELNNLHLSLIKNNENINYIEAYNKAEDNISFFKQKSGNDQLNDIYVIFNGLYGFLLLKLKKQPISKLTEDSIKSFSTLLKLLTQSYHSNL